MMDEAKVRELSAPGETQTEVDPRRLCVLCGKAARWRPVLLVVPSRDYVGKPWRMQVGVAVCDECRHPLPDDLFAVVDKLCAHVKAPTVWEYVCRQLAARGVSKPHYASTRVDYVGLDSEEALGHDAAPPPPTLGPRGRQEPAPAAEPAPVAKVLSISDERALARARERRERRAKLSGGTKQVNETGRGEDDERSTDEGPERADV